ncbi:MAG: hypothetical protein IH991_06705 [Planctomycetes bacterium]|nr:hypothetical protein [Planctomycetota bacterium]
MSREATPYELVDRQCNQQQVVAVLRKYRKDSKEAEEEVRLGGLKEDNIANLRRCVSLRIIPFWEVVTLIRDSEENGHQHVFYYRPKGAIRQLCRNADEIIELLWGDEFAEQQFPQFERIPETYVWADFRKEIPGKPRDWIAKVYGHEIHRDFQDEQEEFEGDFVKVIRQYKQEIIRTVCLVRWNDPDILEVRIDMREVKNSTVIPQRLEQVWRLMSPALSHADLPPWNLGEVALNLIGNRKQKKRDYRLSIIKILDSGSGHVFFYPNTSDEGVDDVPERGASLDRLVNGGGECQAMVINWLAPENPSEGEHPLKKKLRTKIVGDDLNEVIIDSRRDAPSIDYVTNQFRQSDRSTS